MSRVSRGVVTMDSMEEEEEETEEDVSSDSSMDGDGDTTSAPAGSRWPERD